MTMQTGWRWCNKCQGLFFGGSSNQGVCPADRKAHDGSQSGPYGMLFDDSIFDQEQPGWRWCNKCQGLFFGGSPNQGVCPADRNAHDGSQSGRYVTRFGEGTLQVGPISIPFGQAGWRWCHNCQGLFFAGNPPPLGICPAGFAHDPSQSGHYGMMWEVPKPTSRQIDSGWLTSNHPLGGSVKIVLNDNGDFDFSSHVHDSGFDNIDYVVSAVLMTPDGFAFTFQHSGHVEGTVAGLPFGTPNRDDDFVNPAANNPMLGKHWDGVLQGQFTARLDGTDTLVSGLEGVLTDLVKSALAQFEQKAAQAVTALVFG